jgi:hypothetical protein
LHELRQLKLHLGGGRFGEMNYKNRKPKRRKQHRPLKHGYSSEGKQKKIDILTKEFIRDRFSILR